LFNIDQIQSYQQNRPFLIWQIGLLTQNEQAYTFITLQIANFRHFFLES